MSQVGSRFPESVRATPALGSRSPAFPARSYDEDSQIKLRAPAVREAWYEEDPFPLVRERIDLQEVEVVFDDSFFTRPTEPVVRNAPVFPEVPVRNPDDWRGIPEGSLSQEPAPPSVTYEDDDVRADPPRRLSGRAIATRLVFGLFLCGIAALLGYEVRLLLESGASPF